MIKNTHLEFHISLCSLSDTDNSPILKPMICSQSLLAVSHFKFALTLWIAHKALTTAIGLRQGVIWGLGSWIKTEPDPPDAQNPLLHFRNEPEVLM